MIIKMVYLSNHPVAGNMQSIQGFIISNAMVIIRTCIIHAISGLWDGANKGLISHGDQHHVRFLLNFGKLTSSKWQSIFKVRQRHIRMRLRHEIRPI